MINTGKIKLYRNFSVVMVLYKSRDKYNLIGGKGYGKQDHNFGGDRYYRLRVWR